MELYVENTDEWSDAHHGAVIDDISGLGSPLNQLN